MLGVFTDNQARTYDMNSSISPRSFHDGALSASFEDYCNKLPVRYNNRYRMIMLFHVMRQYINDQIYVEKVDSMKEVALRVDSILTTFKHHNPTFLSEPDWEAVGSQLMQSLNMKRGVTSEKIKRSFLVEFADMTPTTSD